MLRLAVGLLLSCAATSGALAVPAVHVASVSERIGSVPLPIHVGGRAAPADGGGYVRQWPGTYFEAAFRGPVAWFRLGAGDVILHVLIDDQPVATLVKRVAGTYRVDGLKSGHHRIRIDVASESQAAPTVFAGFLGNTTKPGTLPRRTRQIEFIGDSHTVGYANNSSKQACTSEEVWTTTDTSRAFGPILARRYGADYQINAISGRGVVRNYNGGAGDPLPIAYPFAVFGNRQSAPAVDWHPHVIVIALGTNDFTTALHAGEPWTTRDALHSDFEAKYVRFVRDLRLRDPKALIVLWATEKANGEIDTEVAHVAENLRASGETRLTYLPIRNLSFAACHSHPSLDDEKIIADKIGSVIDGTVDAWAGR
jgi:lysophospholipase L1-like esterase